MAIAFGPKTKEGTYPVICVNDPSPLAWESDTNLKGDHRDQVLIVHPDQQSNRKFKASQVPQAPIIIK